MMDFTEKGCANMMAKKRKGRPGFSIIDDIGPDNVGAKVVLPVGWNYAAIWEDGKPAKILIAKEGETPCE